ncbi:fluoride efflux transporter CrcB [Aurantibacter sp.]|uniref:fluoride efflux transporter CrcB n=1 Tax=Aurantibacter sp. TaxID=2807103 RepID=UPI0035C851CA
MKNVLLVFLGGGFGSALRYLISKTINTVQFPYGTFLVNCLGCLFIGLILGYTLKSNTLSQNYTLLLATGFCGGFTTFSSFAFENQTFLKSGDFTSFAIYTILSVLIGFTAVFLGLYISKSI